MRGIDINEFSTGININMLIKIHKSGTDDT